ncbi:MAG: PQQ-dependent dehydrogenase, methanol/ethanol family [Deltaproteobacteria bacterium]|nr:PQQ-dependent dehydrogenase, methanol/ethanol family [Deltaproteobacteria bacterium]
MHPFFHNRLGRKTIKLIARSLAVAGALGLFATAMAPGNANAQVSQKMLDDAAKDKNNWLVYGGNYDNTRYSMADQINTKNVKGLRVKYAFQTGVVASFENTPIVVNGVMYVTTPYNELFAIDAATGAEIWHVKHKLQPSEFCCGPNNRGVAVYEDLVYMATLDAMLVAYNRKNGKVEWEVQVGEIPKGYSETMAPTVVDGKILIGTSGAEYGIRGFLKAYDAKTGKEIWTFHTTPEKGWEGTWAEKAADGKHLNRDIAAEKAAMAKYGDAWKIGGASIWMTPAVDRKYKQVIALVGNPSPDLDGSVRPGDNLYSESMVAVDLETGKLNWYIQFVPHDVWDLDAVSPAILTTSGGVDVAVHGGKTGFVYVVNRKDGKLVRLSEPMVPQENMYALPTPEGTRMLPGANGGVEWSPMAYNPSTKNVYAVNLHQPMTYHVDSVPYPNGKLWLGGAFKVIPTEKQSGNISAVNVDTGKIAWQVKTPEPMIGGTLATAGNLVFAGEANGLFKAYDAKDGKILWEFQTGAGANSAPMTFMVKGKQYIAVASGGNAQINSKKGNTLFVFGLD